ncbi:hypothetical protein [Streptomyces albidoflavus]|uniref:hypothetical protein n=1 Tax=Streptomyces albidoflavus TaxID=1886 RepID=UPI0033C1B998
MRHRPATFAALLGLTRAASAIGDFWVQDDFCAQVKGASDDHPVTYIDPTTEQKTTHGTADGRKACLKHCLTYTATQAIVAGAGARALGIKVHPARRRGRARHLLHDPLRRGPPRPGQGRPRGIASDARGAGAESPGAGGSVARVSAPGSRFSGCSDLLI